MPTITKISSGRIFEDLFNDTELNPVWQASPSDPTRYNLNQDAPGKLRLKHGVSSVYFLMDLPNRDFVFEIENDYKPATDSDTGGLVLYRDAQSRLELLEFYDQSAAESVNYTHMRLTRKGNLYSGYGSKDGGKVWELIGAGVADDMTKIGLVLHGADNQDAVPMDIASVKIYTQSYISVGNLTPGMKVDILSSEDVVIATRQVPQERDHVSIDISNLQFPYTGKIRISSNDTVLTTSEDLEMYGGDSFWYGLLLELYRDNHKLSPQIGTFLGGMVNGVNESLFKVKNPSSDPIPNVSIKASKYYDYPGSDKVMIAEDVGGVPGEYFLQEMFLGTVFSGEERGIWIKIQKNSDDLKIIGDRRFFLEINN